MLQSPRTEERLVPVVTRDATSVSQVKPAVIERKDVTITIKEASQTFRVIPPKYKEITEEVKISDEIRRMKVVPAVYEQKEEDVLVESARFVLQACNAPGQRAAAPNTKSLPKTQCLVEIPAKYKKVTKDVLVTPETVKEEITPAKYKTVRRWVLEEDGRTEEQQQPAQLTQLPYEAQVKGPAVVPRPVDAQVEKVNLRTHSGIPQYVLRRVLCDDDLSPALIQKIQSSLASAGVNPGTPDGKLGKNTWLAIQSFQSNRGLAVGLLSFETVEALGVRLKP